MAADDLQVAAARDDRAEVDGDLRVAYRAAVALFATTLVALLLGRGYGIEPPAVDGDLTRRVEGEWVSVPWHLVGARSPQELQLSVDPSACARVVRYEVRESTEVVQVTVWRRQLHSSCVALSVVVRLRAPLGARTVVDGGAITS